MYSQKLLYIFFVFQFTVCGLAQTITSTTAGGLWNNSLTWVGGAVPGENNDVVINGPVLVTSNSICRNITLNSGVTLQNVAGPTTIEIKGNILNNGTILQEVNGWYFSLNISGNITNNGTWKPSATHLVGSGGQYLSQASGKYFEDFDIFQNNDSLGTIYASSNLSFKSRVTFNGNNKWTTLDMQQHALTLDASNGGYKKGHINEITINNPGDIIFINNGVLGWASVIGNPGLKGDIILDAETYWTGTVTVFDSLRNVSGPVTVNIIGNVVNNGMIRQEVNGWYFSLNVTGNITNNGTWKPAATHLVGSGSQYLSQASGKYFEDTDIFQNNDSLGTVYASSNLTFRSRVTFNGNNKWTTLDMQQHALTLDGSSGGYKKGHLNEITIKNPVDIIFTNYGVLGWASVIGNPVLKGDAILDAETYWTGTVTIFDSLRNVSGPVTVNITGNVVNNGIIKQDINGWFFGLNISGNITNNGTWKPYATHLVGSGSQYLSQASGKYFDDADFFQNNDSLGTVYASSNLTFRSRVTFNGNNKWTTLDMQQHVLTLDGSNGGYKKGHINEITINNPGDIVFTNNGVLGWASVIGNPVLKGDAILDAETYWKGTVTVFDSLRNVSGPIAVNVTGSMVNNGIIKQDPNGWYFNLVVYGNVYNYGLWKPSVTHIETGNEERLLSGNLINDIVIEKIEGSSNNLISVDGSFKNSGTLTIGQGSILNIPSGSNYITGGTLYNNGQIINNGTFACYYTVPWAITLNVDPALYTGMKVVEKMSADTVWITSVNNRVHPILSSSVKRWWKIKGSNKIGSYSLSLKYDDALLNNNDENNIEAFLSPDSGKTWKRISTPINTTRDAVNNILYVGTDAYPVTDGFGDIILSSERIVNFPSISSAIGGRSQIRVGPPNRYTISYWNNDNTPTDKFCYLLQTNRGVHIRSIFSKEISTGKIIEIPIDSLTYDGEKDEVILFVEPLAPREVRSFDIVLTAEPGLQIQKPTELITFTAIALWVGGAILEEFVSNTIVEGCYEMWRPVQNNQSLKDASLTCVKNSINKAVTVENGAKGIAKKAAGQIIEKTGKAVVWPVALAKDIYDCLGNAVKGMKDYVNGNFDKQSKDLTKVTSWDPNAKEGPGGFGEQGYMATAAPMLYTIFFENKKEATAAAYEIVVLDTLNSNVFDISTVEFLGMSHPMGVPTRTGNILKWDFVGIELPPNVTPPEGEGWVKFIVHPKNNLPTGTQLKNKAVIKFDLNPWLATNDFINTLDYDAPVTTPTSVIPLSGIEGVVLSWNTDDASGSGIKNSSVYMGVNDGPYTLAAVSDSNSAVVNLKWFPDAKYKFYILSQDNVGNTEKNPAKVMEIVTAVNDIKMVPKTFEISQNYPNPFNPETRINFAVPERGFVELKVFNILGQEIVTLINEEKEIGYYNVKWNAAAYSSGVYFYRISYSGKTFVRKMLLIK